MNGIRAPTIRKMSLTNKTLQCIIHTVKTKPTKLKGVNQHETVKHKSNCKFTNLFP